MAHYSKAEQTLHRVYLSNYFISKATLEMEEIMYGRKASAIEVDEYVFVTGLARSGTTALMNKIYATGAYASLQYSNMPILLAPNLWKRKSKIDAHQRAHQDGIIIDGNSPEEFDEYFWKVFLNDSYIHDNGMVPHDIPADVLEKYKTFIRLVCLAKGKHKYISKNNNSILRLSGLNKIEGSHVIVLFREPIAHASSLLKLHRSFSESQENDPFELEYFNYLGHHEFGKGQKPFLLTDAFKSRRESYPKDHLDFWLSTWINYYEYLLQQPSKYHLICFEDLVSQEARVFGYLSKMLTIQDITAGNKQFKPPKYSDIQCDAGLLAEAQRLYNKLLSQIQY